MGSRSYCVGESGLSEEMGPELRSKGQDGPHCWGRVLCTERKARACPRRRVWLVRSGNWSSQCGHPGVRVTRGQGWTVQCPQALGGHLLSDGRTAEAPGGRKPGSAGLGCILQRSYPHSKGQGSLYGCLSYLSYSLPLPPVLMIALGRRWH